MQPLTLKLDVKSDEDNMFSTTKKELKKIDIEVNKKDYFQSLIDHKNYCDDVIEIKNIENFDNTKIHYVKTKTIRSSRS